MKTEEKPDRANQEHVVQFLCRKHTAEQSDSEFLGDRGDKYAKCVSACV